MPSKQSQVKDINIVLDLDHCKSTLRAQEQVEGERDLTLQKLCRILMAFLKHVVDASVREWMIGICIHLNKAVVTCLRVAVSSVANVVGTSAKCLLDCEMYVLHAGYQSQLERWIPIKTPKWDINVI